MSKTKGQKAKTLVKKAETIQAPTYTFGEARYEPGEFFSVDPRDLVIITDESHPRYDPRVKLPIPPLFVESVKTHGIKQTVTIYPSGEVDDGRKRVRTAILLGLPEVRACVVPFPETDIDAVLSSLEMNTQREDVDDATLATLTIRAIRAGVPMAAVSRATARPESSLQSLCKIHMSGEAWDLLQTGVVDLRGALNVAQQPTLEAQTAVAMEIREIAETALAAAEESEDGRVMVVGVDAKPLASVKEGKVRVSQDGAGAARDAVKAGTKVAKAVVQGRGHEAKQKAAETAAATTSTAPKPAPAPAAPKLPRILDPNLLLSLEINRTKTIESKVRESVLFVLAFLRSGTATATPNVPAEITSAVDSVVKARAKR